MLAIKKVADSNGVYAIASGMANFDNYPTADWIRNPNTGAVKDLEPRYWRPSPMMPNIIVPKNQADQDAIDGIIKEQGKVAREAPGRSEYGQPFAPSYQYYEQIAPVTSQGNRDGNNAGTNQSIFSGTLKIPAKGTYEIILSYAFSSNNTGTDVEIHLKLDGIEGVNNDHDFFWHRIEVKESGGRPRLTTSPALGTDQELFYFGRRVLELSPGDQPFILQKLTERDNRVGTWDITISCERKA